MNVLNSYEKLYTGMFSIVSNVLCGGNRYEKSERKKRIGSDPDT